MRVADGRGRRKRGCLQEAGTPEEQFEKALQGLAGGVGPDGDVQRIVGEGEVEGMAAEVEIEFGLGDVTRIVMDAGMYRLEMVCTPDRMVLSMMDESYESRVDEEACNMDSEDGPGLPIHEEWEAELDSLEVKSDGSLVAVMVETVDDVELRTIMTVRDGRVVEVTVEDEEGTYTMEVMYGKRRSIPVPSADQRSPATVRWDADFATGVYNATVAEADGALPLDEFEVQVHQMGETVAAFPLDTSGEQTVGAFTFTYQDDGDGLLSDGDAFAIRSGDWDQEHDYDVIVFDEWAGMPTQEFSVPMPGVAWFVLVGLLLFAVRTGNPRRP